MDLDSQIINSRADVRNMNTKEYISAILKNAELVHPEKPEYRQALREFMPTVEKYIDEHPEIIQYNLLAILVEPERVVKFRVPWQDDEGTWRLNMGMRVQYNSTLGPYKGGTRFDLTVNESIIRFLAFEQTFKNALTGLPIGGGKGGSNFNPVGKSDSEVMRFCQSYMTELQRYLGPNTDIPAGDIGVHAREVGYLYGQYKRLNQNDPGVITGKPFIIGGSNARPEATGYGTVYFVENLLDDLNEKIANKKFVVSGIGAVGGRAIEKVLELGGEVVAVSDISGYIVDPNGIDLDTILELGEDPNQSLKDYKERRPDAIFKENKSVWDADDLKYDIALPCATQNEINKEMAEKMIKAGVTIAAEGANMPLDESAAVFFRENGVIHCPGKAVNAGGVAVSALEMSQNSQRLQWPFEEVDKQLQRIMKNIYENCKETGAEYSKENDFVTGANIAGFKTVSEAMLIQGLV